MFGSSARKQRRMQQIDPLGILLINLAREDAYTARMATENILVTGSSGAGKTTGSGRMLAHALLGTARAGMLICAAKADEVALWEKYADVTGRSADLRVIRPGGPWRFNPVSYELDRKGAVASAESVVGLLEAILECADRQGNAGGSRDSEPYWRLATKQLIRNFVDLVILATGTVTIESLYRAVISAPQSLDDVRSEQWRESSYCFQLLTEADKRTKGTARTHDFALVADYVLCELASLAQRTRSIIVSNFTSQIDPMQRGVLREIFGTDTTVTPDDCENGAIIVCGLSTQTFRETGLIANTALKYCWQRSMEARQVTPDSRLACLWCDEFQVLVRPQHDAQFLATCRSSRVGCVLLTQGVPGVYAALGGGEMGKAQADSIFGNCSTKIFHANSDPQTNDWASSVIGRSRQFMASGNSSYSAEDEANAAIGMGWLPRSGSSSAGFSEVFEYEVQPREFTRLRTGGPANRGLVDAIVFQNGKVFKGSGRNWLPVTFKQQL